MFPWLLYSFITCYPVQISTVISQVRVKLPTLIVARQMIFKNGWCNGLLITSEFALVTRGMFCYSFQIQQPFYILIKISLLFVWVFFFWLLGVRQSIHFPCPASHIQRFILIEKWWMHIKSAVCIDDWMQFVNVKHFERSMKLEKEKFYLSAVHCAGPSAVFTDGCF